MRLRLAKEKDTKEILDIYAQYIDTAISFEYVLPDTESFKRRIEGISKGYGKKLYTALMEILQLQGVKTVYGLVTVPNEKSEALHESMGFERIGICKNTGYKSGAWRDVAWFEKQIGDYGTDPKPICTVRGIPREKIEEILRKNS